MIFAPVEVPRWEKGNRRGRLSGCGKDHACRAETAILCRISFHIITLGDDFIPPSCPLISGPPNCPLLWRSRAGPQADPGPESNPWCFRMGAPWFSLETNPIRQRVVWPQIVQRGALNQKESSRTPRFHMFARIGANHGISRKAIYSGEISLPGNMPPPGARKRKKKKNPHARCFVE